MGGAIAAAFVATFPDLVEDEVVLLASAGLLEAADLSRTAKFMSSPSCRRSPRTTSSTCVLPPPPRGRRAAARGRDARARPPAVRAPPGLQPRRVVLAARGARHGPALALRAPRGREKGVDLHGTDDTTVPPAHAPRIAALLGAPRAQLQGNDSETTTTPHPDSATHPQTARTQVELALIPGAGQGLTWTHAGEVGKAVCAFFGEA
ncbi:hypothetical protein B0H17DRAFT_1088284 [Mycena rosella]|uniref:Uncharacterized protein n=1 Tax=Mycena rosella TaxID=1033263 RepID=A0AAD7G985_MYCRO|nr:hypothetical protein B0H17DRAFT_1088284 [Mycena rosella]